VTGSFTPDDLLPRRSMPLAFHLFAVSSVPSGALVGPVGRLTPRRHEHTIQSTGSFSIYLILVCVFFSSLNVDCVPLDRRQPGSRGVPVRRSPGDAAATGQQRFSSQSVEIPLFSFFAALSVPRCRRFRKSHSNLAIKCGQEFVPSHCARFCAALFCVGYS